MTHPIISLQGALVAALNEDAALTALIGESAVFDAPPKGAAPPYVVVARHDAAARDGDLAPGHEHRVVLQVWVAEASRRALLEIVERVVAVATSAPLSGAELAVTLAAHVRTETQIDGRTGRARAAVTLRFLSEAVE